jgi:hypothetical protein
VDDRAFRRRFFQQLTLEALEPDSPLYVPIYDDAEISADDPVALMQWTIEATVGASVQLFSGFRGSGKSTELRRLRRRLQAGGYTVLLVDVEDYLNLSSPIDVPDFLLAVAGAIGDEAVASAAVDDDPEQISYWNRFTSFLRSVQLAELAADTGVSPAKVGVKANLRDDPTFVAQLQQRMARHQGAFVEDVHDYVGDVVRQITKKNPATAGVVLLVDSIEHIRGVFANSEQVQRSIGNLFVVNASNLRLPGTHVVYTAPPWLRIRYANLETLYDTGGVTVLLSLKVHTAGTRAPYEPGLNILRAVVEQREAKWRALVSEEQLRRISLASGGHLRDLLRILMDVIRRASTVPTSDAVIDRALASARDQSLPVPNSDAVWLARIARSNTVELSEVARLSDLARFLDTHLLLCYRNGQEWYDLHPLVRDVILEQAQRVSDSGGHP